MKSIQTKILRQRDRRFPVTHRQQLIAGFDQSRLRAATVVLIGAGGINGEVAEGMCRKGVGRLRVFDHDVVEATNLNRQHFFLRDIGRNKAERLVTNLAPHCHAGTRLDSHPLSFQDARALKVNLRGSVVVCGVDNGKARVLVSDYYRRMGTPVIFIAVDLHGEAGHVFVQEGGPASACFGCAFPRTMHGAPAPCFVPAVKDTLKVTAGLALYAIDSLLMERRRNWNYRRVHLAGYAPDESSVIKQKLDCPLCHAAGKP